MLLNSLKQAIHLRNREKEHKKHNLFYLFWECTQRCNLSCLHCGSDCASDSQYRDMPKEDLFRVLDNINEYNHESTTVIIAGGEPLLRKDLEECGFEIRKRGFRWGIVTNGYVYTRERHISLLNAGMGSITLSLDGISNTHNWLRNNSKSFDRALNALQLIASSDRLYSDVVTCVNKQNLNQLEDIYQLIIQNGGKAWRLFTITPIGRATENPDMLLNTDEFTHLMEFIKAKRQRKELDVKFSCEGYVGTYEKKVREDYFFCRAGINVASVLIDGSIGACPNINRSFIQGNIYEDNFMDVWNTRYQMYRNREWTKTGQCASCQEYKYCKGNGLHYWPEDKANVLTCHYQLIKK
ncbi:TIGR04133 family radical SAM/SPASM protein [Dysgonomonas sp. Marseille-P4677]|uniref:TIGR04133 family radical SAM/SPASM protein n=1 Tax=Dysgonomonas sp. Marseille-P4677 TaxID=2364790 RepID=UPI0019130554|nr:TIGR04133 family radical SAM/SPASM protein [Dysgonomonas sp. Marseille-P4677]MBK5720591.1 TIGR04133 family radical SAM/SPASM protein [Dysgonomonas sp. Marseille-P4677]